MRKSGAFSHGRDAFSRRQFDCDSVSRQLAGQPSTFTGRFMPSRSAISRSLARVVVKKRPASRPSRSFSNRFCQFWRYNPAARRSRPTPPKSKPCPGERVARCSRRVGRSSPAKSLASFLRASNPTHGGLRSDRATENLPDRPRHVSRQHCRLSLRPTERSHPESRHVPLAA